MTRVFVDTTALVAYFNKRDNYHAEARGFFRSLPKKKVRPVITDYIFDEFVTMALRRAGHALASASGEHLLNSGIVEVVWLDESVKSKAWDYFKQHDDKQFSFTDCTSFALMKEMDIKQYFGFDDHFKQAGFAPFS